MNLDDTPFKGMKILVTGAAGFLGANVTEELLHRGAVVRGTIHKRQPVIKDPSIEYVQADLTNKDDCARVVVGMDYVFMCAASTGGAGIALASPLSVATPNIIMNTLMLDAAYAAKIKKFVFISSNAVYPAYDHAVKEDEMMSGPPFDKYFPAAWAKRFAEILCETYSAKIKDPMATVVVRPANMYGPLDNFDPERSHVVPGLIRKVVERHNPLEVWGDGMDIKDLIYVKDFIEGLLLAFEKVDTYDPINIGTGIPVSVNDVLHAALEVEGYNDAKIVYNPSKPTMIPKRLLDVSKAQRLLGFTAKTPLKEGIAKTIEWYKSAIV